MFNLLQRSNYAKLRFLKRCFGTNSQLHQDVKKTNQLFDSISSMDNLNQHQGKFASKLADFDLSPGHSAHNFEALSLPIKVQSQGYSRDHPLEIAVKKERQKADIFSKLNQNEMLLTNLPFELEPWMKSQKLFKEYLKQQVHKDLEVFDISYINAVTTPSQLPRLAYIKLTLGTKRQAYLVKTFFRNIWLGDNLLKVKMSEDLPRETFDKRTVIIRDVPIDLNQREILELFTEDYGAVVGIELPVENIKLQKLIDQQQLSSPTSPFYEEKANKFKAAQIQVKEALDSFAIKQIENQLGPDVLQSLGSQDTQAIDQERQKSLIRIVTRLQAENIKVLNQKYELLQIRDSNQASVSLTENNLKQKIELNRGKVEKVMRFLKENQESNTLVNYQPIDSLLKLTQGELAHAFDELIKALTKREQLIEQRIGEQLKHFGLDERVLLEGKNFNLELENMPNLDKKHTSPEQIISLQDQINYIIQAKNISPEEKFSKLMRKAFNPFGHELFSKQQLRLAEGNQILQKETELFDIHHKTKSVIRMFREGTNFTKESQSYIDELVNDLRVNFDVPFEELYHKEKALVNAVVHATKALRAKEEQFIDLLKGRMVGKADVKKVEINSMLAGEYEDLFEKGQQKQMVKIQKQTLQEDVTGSYKISTTANLMEKVQTGELTQTEYDQLVQNGREQEIRNLGYCFVTFSHSDEARMMILKNPYPYLNGHKIQLDMKQNVDHSELDIEFYMGRLKNDSKVIDEIKTLREAKKELRDFEKDIDNQFPNSKNLKNFRNLARNVLSESSKTDSRILNERNEQEMERIREKVIELEKKYPHIDMSQIFGSEKAEAARRALHKNAFASYKAYEFLKHNIIPESKQEKAKSEAKQRLENNDPYNFPELDQTVAKVLSKDVLQPSVIDHGEKINKPGRRFSGYTDSEFIEAFFGKDMMRNQVVDRVNDPLFLEQKSLKEKYPVSQFLKMPEIQTTIDGFKAMGYAPNYKSIDFSSQKPIIHSSDPGYAQMQQQVDEGLNFGGFLKDLPHPTQKGRTMLTDLNSNLEKYEKARAKRDVEPDSYEMKEIAAIRSSLVEEYKPLEHDAWWKLVKKGKWTEKKTQVIEDETKSAKFQTQYDNEKEEKMFDQNVILDAKQDRINKEYLYNFQSPSSFEKQQYLQDHQSLVEKSGLTADEIAKMSSTQALLPKTDKQYGGSWFAQHEYSQSQMKTKASETGRSLESFANDEDDIYEQYQRQVKDQPRETKPKLPKLDRETLQPDMPRFADFLNQKSQNIHPFDQITDKVNQQNSLNKLTGDTPEEIEEEKLLYQREILGRLMGERLTPRQFEMITGTYSQADIKLQRVINQKEQEFESQRQMASLAQEFVEKIRREQVKKGVWTEEDSNKKIKTFLEEKVKALPGSNYQKKFNRDLADVMDALKMLSNPERILEKEYHFDETLGESLDDHCETLKKQYPGVTVQTRRDRDGFAIVKTLFLQEYKYDINKIEQFDPEIASSEHNQTVEAILSTLLPNSSHQEIIDDVSKNMTSIVKKMFNNQQYDLDSFTKLKIQNLVNMKVNKKIETKDLIKELFLICDNAGFDESRLLPSYTGGTVFENLTPNWNPQAELMADRERFRAEINEQLTSRVQQHMYHKKRTEQDFVKPRVSEQGALKGQIVSNDRSLNELENEVKSADESSKNFDKEAYYKMKQEIQQRKQAKERLLSQGMPEFKAYLRI